MSLCRITTETSYYMTVHKTELKPTILYQRMPVQLLVVCFPIVIRDRFLAYICYCRQTVKFLLAKRWWHSAAGKVMIEPCRSGHVSQTSRQLLPALITRPVMHQPKKFVWTLWRFTHFQPGRSSSCRISPEVDFNHSCYLGGLLMHLLTQRQDRSWFSDNFNEFWIFGAVHSVADCVLIILAKLLFFFWPFFKRLICTAIMSETPVRCEPNFGQPIILANQISFYISNRCKPKHKAYIAYFVNAGDLMDCGWKHGG